MVNTGEFNTGLFIDVKPTNIGGTVDRIKAGDKVAWDEARENMLPTVLSVVCCLENLCEEMKLLEFKDYVTGLRKGLENGDATVWLSFNVEKIYLNKRLRDDDTLGSFLYVPMDFDMQVLANPFSQIIRMFEIALRHDYYPAANMETYIEKYGGALLLFLANVRKRFPDAPVIGVQADIIYGFIFSEKLFGNYDLFDKTLLN